jgi:hypothetical protein
VTGHSFSGPGADFTTVKYSNAGMPLWTNIYDFVTGGSDVANAIAVDNTDNVVVTGVAAATIMRQSHIQTPAYRCGPTATTAVTSTAVRPPPLRWTQAATCS